MTEKQLIIDLGSVQMSAELLWRIKEYINLIEKRENQNEKWLEVLLLATLKKVYQIQTQKEARESITDMMNIIETFNNHPLE